MNTPEQNGGGLFFFFHVLTQQKRRVESLPFGLTLRHHDATAESGLSIFPKAGF
jgi:hypothetical protein